MYDHQAALRQLYEEGFNQGRLELLEHLCTSDFLAAPGDKGVAAFAQGVAALRAGFPDVRFDIEDMFGASDRVAVRWRFEATHAGMFQGHAATGRRVSQTANVIYQFKEGKIWRAWIQVDRLGLLQQISP
ncbi:ester cyclase [Hylemonella gracilis]|uniref:Ester cyclase n=1 Tax=Hylemonella gracilis TaxID=80880 RepID=A0A4P6UM13_9BURK|nr:ester cyclase [Hylemonella gracilis]QBK06262.1 ester cyclase [Hylemonella gracilis]